MDVSRLDDEFGTRDSETINVDHSKNECFLGTFEVFHEFCQIGWHANS